MFNRTTFFNGVRHDLFGGAISPSQVAGCESLLSACEERHFSAAATAYVLATAFHETGKTMRPITEYGGRKYFEKYDVGRLAKKLGNTPALDGDGYRYRGRGYVQLTGLGNYRHAGEHLAVDLVGNPDLALDLEIAARIAITGMSEGWFTGRKLADYFSGGRVDFHAARAIINGSDRAATIAGYAEDFFAALQD